MLAKVRSQKLPCNPNLDIKPTDAVHKQLIPSCMKTDDKKNSTASNTSLKFVC